MSLRELDFWITKEKVQFLMDIFNKIFSYTLKLFHSSVLEHCPKESGIRQDLIFPLQNPDSENKLSPLIKNDFKPGKIEASKLFFFILSFCNPISCPIIPGALTCDQSKPLMFRIPCEIKYVNSNETKKEKPKPIGIITRIKDMELHGGEIIQGCSCGRRNGLDGDAECRRSCCQNNPGCYMKPPQCWPQFKEPVEPPKPKMICIPVDVVYYDPSSKQANFCKMK